MEAYPRTTKADAPHKNEIAATLQIAIGLLIRFEVGAACTEDIFVGIKFLPQRGSQFHHTAGEKTLATGASGGVALHFPSEPTLAHFQIPLAAHRTMNAIIGGTYQVSKSLLWIPRATTTIRCFVRRRANGFGCIQSYSRIRSDGLKSNQREKVISLATLGTPAQRRLGHCTGYPKLLNHKMIDPNACRRTNPGIWPITCDCIASIHRAPPTRWT